MKLQLSALVAARNLIITWWLLLINVCTIFSVSINSDVSLLVKLHLIALRCDKMKCPNGMGRQNAILPTHTRFVRRKLAPLFGRLKKTQKSSSIKSSKKGGSKMRPNRAWWSHFRVWPMLPRGHVTHFNLRARPGAAIWIINYRLEIIVKPHYTIKGKCRASHFIKITNCVMTNQFIPSLQNKIRLRKQRNVNWDFSEMLNSFLMVFWTLWRVKSLGSLSALIHGNGVVNGSYCYWHLSVAMWAYVSRFSQYWSVGEYNGTSLHLALYYQSGQAPLVEAMKQSFWMFFFLIFRLLTLSLAKMRNTNALQIMQQLFASIFSSSLNTHARLVLAFRHQPDALLHGAKLVSDLHWYVIEVIA